MFYFLFSLRYNCRIIIKESANLFSCFVKLFKIIFFSSDLCLHFLLVVSLSFDLNFSFFFFFFFWYFVVHCKVFLWNKIRSSLKFIPTTRPNHRPKISLSKSFFVYVLELLCKLNCRSEFKKQNLVLLFCPRIVIFVVQVVICSVIKLFVLYFS